MKQVLRRAAVTALGTILGVSLIVGAKTGPAPRPAALAPSAHAGPGPGTRPAAGGPPAPGSDGPAPGAAVPETTAPAPTTTALPATTMPTGAPLAPRSTLVQGGVVAGGARSTTTARPTTSSAPATTARPITSSAPPTTAATRATTTSTEPPTTSTEPSTTSTDPGPATTTTTAPPPPPGSQTVDSPVFYAVHGNEKYGPVQVRLTFDGHRIVEAVALQLPDHAAKSRQINARAAPILRQEVLDAQSAQIDTVSGATATSEAYSQCVQAILDQAWK